VGHPPEARVEVVHEPLVVLPARRLGHDDERRPAADAPELVLERLQAGAVARQELAQIGVRVGEDLEREEPGTPEHTEREEEHDERVATARVDDGADRLPHPASGRGEAAWRISSWMRRAWVRASKSRTALARAARPCRARSAGIAHVAQHGLSEALHRRVARPLASRGLEWHELARLGVEHLGHAADVEGDDRPGQRHRLDDRPRERIRVDAGHHRDVEVGHERAHVGPEPQQVKGHPSRAPPPAPALGDVIRTEVLRRVPHHDERHAPALGRGHRVEREPRRAHHLDVPLATEHAPVAADDDDVRREAELRAQRRPHALGIEVPEVERVVDDAHLVRAVREEGRRRMRYAHDAAHAPARAQAAVHARERARAATCTARARGRAPR
jgi:hypothetical protein